MRSSVKPTDDHLTDELVGRTREVWQPRLDRTLSRAAATQIATNVTGLFVILAEWSRAEQPEPGSGSAIGSPAERFEGLHDR